SPHRPGQEQDQSGEEDQDNQADDVGHHEWYDAAEDRHQTHVTGYGLDDEDIHPDRRRDQSELDGHHDDDTEPDGVKAQRHDDRIDDRNRQDDRRHGIQKATHDDEQGPDQSQGSVGPEAEVDQHLRQLLRHLGDGQEIAEEDSADQDRIDRDG